MTDTEKIVLTMIAGALLGYAGSELFLWWQAF